MTDWYILILSLICISILEASQNGSQPFSVELEVSSTSSSKRSEVSIQIQQQLPTTEEVLEEALDDGDDEEEEGDKGEDVIIRRVIVRPWKPD